MLGGRRACSNRAAFGGGGGGGDGAKGSVVSSALVLVRERGAPRCGDHGCKQTFARCAGGAAGSCEPALLPAGCTLLPAIPQRPPSLAHRGTCGRGAASSGSENARRPGPRARHGPRAGVCGWGCSSRRRPPAGASAHRRLPHATHQVGRAAAQTLTLRRAGRAARLTPARRVLEVSAACMMVVDAGLEAAGPTRRGSFGGRGWQISAARAARVRSVREALLVPRARSLGPASCVWSTRRPLASPPQLRQLQCSHLPSPAAPSPVPLAR